MHIRIKQERQIVKMGLVAHQPLRGLRLFLITKAQWEYSRAYKPPEKNRICNRFRIELTHRHMPKINAFFIVSIITFFMNNSSNQNGFCAENQINRVNNKEFTAFLKLFRPIVNEELICTNELGIPFFDKIIDEEIARKYFRDTTNNNNEEKVFEAGYALYFKTYIITISSLRIINSEKNEHYFLQVHSFKNNGRLIYSLINLAGSESDFNNDNFTTPYVSELFIEYEPEINSSIRIYEERTFGSDIEIRNNYEPKSKPINIIVSFDHKGNLHFKP